MRIAAAVGDAELADQAVTLAERRAQQNPSVVSCEAALAHCRGIWNESGDDLARAASTVQRRQATAGLCLSLGGPR